MRVGGGRAKGGAFEREVAKMIIAAFAHKGITREDCARSRTPGKDLNCSKALQKYFPFAIECKFYKRCDWDKLLTKKKKKGNFSKWWAQCTASANGRPPLLVFKQNRSDVFAVGPNHELGTFNDYPTLQTQINGMHVRVFRFKDLLQHYSNVHSSHK